MSATDLSGVTLFRVRETVTKKKKSELVPILFGVSPEAVMRIDVQTRAVLKVWPFRSLRRWAASPKSLTLDFGNEEAYYTIQTSEGEVISRLISDYADAILEKKKDADRILVQKGTSRAVVEDAPTAHARPTSHQPASDLVAVGQNDDRSYAPAKSAPSPAGDSDNDVHLKHLIDGLGIPRDVAQSLRRDHVTKDDLMAAEADGTLERVLRDDYGIALLKVKGIQARVRAAMSSASAPVSSLAPTAGATAVTPSSGRDRAVIAMSDLILPPGGASGNVLGRGAFGTVISGFFRGAAVAIKSTENATPSERADLRAEAALLAGMGAHPNVVQFIGVAVRPTDNAIFIVTELCDGGDLLKALRDAEFGPLWTASNRIGILTDVARGMWHLAEQRIVHRDLAARNVLLVRRVPANLTNAAVRAGGAVFSAKVSDFGLSRANADESMTVARPRPIAWTAPEAFSGGLNGAPPMLTTASDVWSFGVLTWEMATRGRRPYEGVADIRAAVLAGQRLQAPADSSDAERRVMLVCGERDPARRPTFKGLCQLLASASQSSDAHQSRYVALPSF